MFLFLTLSVSVANPKKTHFNTVVANPARGLLKTEKISKIERRKSGNHLPTVSVECAMT